ncbi:MAG: phage holin family protein [bacterium]|nr:phage holin family protein [bacterium]
MARIIMALLSNWLALWLSDKYIVNFDVVNETTPFVIVVILLAIANSFFLPMLRFMFKPFIWLTAGLLAVVLNGAMIYLVDFFSDSITINGLLPLLYATILFGVINALFALGAQAFKKS